MRVCCVYVCRARTRDYVCIHILYIIIHAWLILALGEFLCSFSSPPLFFFSPFYPFPTSESRKSVVWTLSMDMIVAREASLVSGPRANGGVRLDETFRGNRWCSFFCCLFFIGSNSSVPR